MPQWFVIGITGVTCGGKTTVSKRLRDFFLHQKYITLKYDTKCTINEVKLISQDEYFLHVNDNRHRKVKALDAINFELLTALDMRKMVSDIEEILDYNFSKLTQTDKNARESNEKLLTNITQSANQKITSTSNDAYVTIINDQKHYGESFFKVPSNGELSDNTINILIIEGFIIFEQTDILLICDVKYHFHLTYEICYERRKKRVYDPPDVLGYYEMCIWPHYEKYYSQLQNHKDIIIVNGALNSEKIYNYILHETCAHLGELFMRKKRQTDWTKTDCIAP